jgi:hypothetical protein
MTTIVMVMATTTMVIMVANSMKTERMSLLRHGEITVTTGRVLGSRVDTGNPGWRIP